MSRASTRRGARHTAFEDVQRLEVPVDGCWEISVVDAVGGLLENRILFGGPHPADDDGTPPEGIAAWAKLTVSWALTGTAGGRG